MGGRREALPSVPWGHWGSCAVVAPGESLLTYENGAEIDAHDLVIRVGGGGADDAHQPTAGFQRHVGSRTDVYVANDAREGRKFAKSNPELKFCKLKPYRVTAPPINLCAPNCPRHSFLCLSRGQE